MKLEDYIQDKVKEVKVNVKDDSFPSLERFIYIDTLLNLTNYNKTNSNPRDDTIREAFQILKDMVQFDFNESGSFTPMGAVDAYDSDVDVTEIAGTMQVSVTGKLEEMELGKTNWKNLTRYFYNKGIKRRIQNKYPNKWRSLYNRLDQLFKMTNDPTAPQGRPYVSSALTLGATQMGNKYMKDNIMKAFGSSGKWSSGAGK
jgi:hypothetical protein